MLLSTAIQTQQDSYAQIQVQIEALQEKQRHIQAYLQRLGSIESKMESAAQLLQEAIADIRSECPDELAGYEQLITGFFGDASVAFLEAAVEEVSEDVPADDTPQEAFSDIGAEVIATEAEVIATEEEQPEEVSQDDAATATDSTEQETQDTTTIEATAVKTNHVIIEGVEIQPILPVPLQIETMTKYMVCKWLGDLGLEFKRSEPVGNLRARLKAFVSNQQAA